MAKENKAIRLSKLAREINVGISTIVDFLKKKGYDVKPNPNAKVTQEQYELLAKEYSSDINVKKESEKLNMNKSQEDEEDSVGNTDAIEDEDEEITEKEDSEDEILIKDVSGKKEEKKPEKEE